MGAAARLADLGLELPEVALPLRGLRPPPVCGFCERSRAGPRSPRDLCAGWMTTTLGRMATTWEYATIPLIIHNTKAVLDQWGADGWELVQVIQGPDAGLVAYLKRPKES